MPISESKKAKTIELMQKAVELRIQQWDALWELEKLLGGQDINGLDDLVESYATSHKIFGQIDGEDIVNGVNDLMDNACCSTNQK